MDEDSWSILLLESPLFKALRDAGCQHTEGSNVLCEVRGDLFVWSEALEVLLTTNLKRLKANPGETQVYQQLYCTSTPVSPVCRIVPDQGGVHIALQCSNALSVVKLTRRRGEFGEFGGGKNKVNCKTIQIASHLFLVHGHFLKLLQATWLPTQPGAICMLTSDGTLHLYHLANPNIAMTTIPLGGYSHARYNLGEMAISLAVSPPPSSPLLFVLRDGGDIHTASLIPQTSLSPPLVMHPDEETNYGSDACSILTLSSLPLAVIIANKNGKIYHCIFMPHEQTDDSAGIPDTLYVVECVQLELPNSAESMEISLIADPIDSHRYFASHQAGVHMVSLPWLGQMESFSVTDATLVVDSKAQVEYVLATEPGVIWLQGVAIVTEPLLGSTLVGLTSDLECVTIPLTNSPVPYLPPHHLPRPPSRELDHHSSGLEETIWSILKDEGEGEGESSPVVRMSGRKELSQQECLQFLTRSIQDLRRKYIIPQKRAKDELEHRIEVLVRQKQQQLQELFQLEDDRGGVEGALEDLLRRLEEQSVRSQQLMRRVEQLVCQLDMRSPVISEAEQAMCRELMELLERLKPLQSRLREARAKLDILMEAEGRYSAEVSLSAKQIQTVLATLTESGQNIKSLKDQLRSLASLTPT